MSTVPPPVASASTSAAWSAATSLIRARVSLMTRMIAASRRPWRLPLPFEASEAAASACAQPMPATWPRPLHPLKGDRRGLWSVWVSGNWRVVFRFEGTEAVDVSLIDYH